MPRALDPSYEFTIVLRSDDGKMEYQQPRLVYKALNGRQWREIAKKIDSFEKTSGLGTALEMCFDVISSGLIRWDNMNDPETGEAIPFAPENLDLILDPTEAVEVMYALVNSGRVSAADRKKSESPV